MAIDTLKTLEVIETMENFIYKRRPPENIRYQLDLSYQIENQSIIIFEIRPKWNKPDEKWDHLLLKQLMSKKKITGKFFGNVPI